MSGRNYFLRIHAAGNKSGALLLTIFALTNRRSDEELTIRPASKRTRAALGGLTIPRLRRHRRLPGDFVEALFGRAELAVKQLGALARFHGVFENVQRGAAGIAEFGIRLFQFGKPRGLREALAFLRKMQVRANASEEFAGGEGLHQIIVGARGKAFDFRFLAGARREENDWNLACPGIGSQGAQQLKSIHPRHHNVRHYEIWRALARGAQGGLALRDRFHVVQTRKQSPHIITHVGIIVGEKDFASRRAVRVRL